MSKTLLEKMDEAMRLPVPYEGLTGDPIEEKLREPSIESSKAHNNKIQKESRLVLTQGGTTPKD